LSLRTFASVAFGSLANAALVGAKTVSLLLAGEGLREAGLVDEAHEGRELRIARRNTHDGVAGGR
jgi:hypothetical protein